MNLSLLLFSPTSNSAKLSMALLFTFLLVFGFSQCLALSQKPAYTQQRPGCLIMSGRANFALYEDIE